jgi:hypothetical protein
MKTLKSKSLLSGLILFVLMFFSTQFVMGQAAGNNNTKMQDKKEKVEAMKVAYLTDKLSLTSADAEKFWPVYNEFQDKKDALQKTYRQKVRIVKDQMAANLTDAQADDVISANLQQDQDLLDLKKEYVPKFKKLIGSKKVVLLFTSEKDFNKLLLEKLKESKQ